MRLKKVKDAREMVEGSSYYINNPIENRGKWKKVFQNDNDIHIEIGMGKGKFIIEMAKSNPNINFIGIEKYDSVMVKATNMLEKMEFMPNLKLILIDAEKIEDIFYQEIDRIYLNFSDPWPKARHEKRRLTSEKFLRRYENIFRGRKEIVQKTDNRTFFDYSYESIKAFGYKIDSVTYDLYSQNDASKVPTENEEKFRNRGIKINRLKAHKDSNMN